MKRVIVISTRDLYGDCWKPLLLSFKQQWPDCPYPIYMITNNKDVDDEMVTTIKVGEHKGWGSNTKKALSQIDCDYLLYLQEDFFLVDKVNTDGVRENFEFCESNQVDYLRVMEPFKDNYPYQGNLSYCEDAEVTLKFHKRALNLMAVIWKKDALLKMCVEGWTGWDYERKNLTYLKENNIQLKKLVINSKVDNRLGLPVMESTGIRKGLWTREGYEYLMRNGFVKEAHGRKVESHFITWCMKQTNPILQTPCAIIIRIIQKFY